MFVWQSSNIHIFYYRAGSLLWRKSGCLDAECLTSSSQSPSALCHAMCTLCRSSENCFFDLVSVRVCCFIACCGMCAIADIKSQSHSRGYDFHSQVIKYWKGWGKPMCQTRKVADTRVNENRPAVLLTGLGWQFDEIWGQTVGKDNVHVCKPFQQHAAWGLMLSKINENISAWLIQPAHLLTLCNTEIDHCRHKFIWRGIWIPESL